MLFISCCDSSFHKLIKSFKKYNRIYGNFSFANFYIYTKPAVHWSVYVSLKAATLFTFIFDGYQFLHSRIKQSRGHKWYKRIIIFKSIEINSALQKKKKTNPPPQTKKKEPLSMIEIYTKGQLCKNNEKIFVLYWYTAELKNRIFIIHFSGKLFWKNCFDQRKS